MENVVLDRRSSGSFELPKMSVGRCRRGLGSTRAAAAPRGAYNRSSFPTCQPPYHQQHNKAGGASWSSAPAALPYASTPPIYSSPYLPLLPSNQPPLLPFPPAATKYATFPCLPAPPPPPPPRAVMGAPATATNVPAVAAPAAARPRDRRRRPTRPPPPSNEPTIKEQKKKKPLERATPLPPAPAVNEALDDLEQEVARNFVQDLLHALAPPPSSLPLPRFSLVAKATSPDRVVAPAAPSCNVEAAAADGIRGLLRL